MNIGVNQSEKYMKSLDEIINEKVNECVEKRLKEKLDEHKKSKDKFNKRLNLQIIVSCIAICFLPFLAIYLHDILMHDYIKEDSTYLQIIIPALITAVCGVLAFLGFQKLLHFDEEKEMFQDKMEKKFKEYKQEAKDSMEQQKEYLKSEMNNKIQELQLKINK